MDKAILFTGKKGIQEIYQLLIDCNYISITYNGSAERIPFYEEVSDTFVERILAKHSSLEVGVFNGLRINPETGNHEGLDKLEDALVSQFSEMVCEKLKRNSIGTIPASLRN